MVGISLLTLVPGELGGSETYARELLGALGRSGELEYRVLLPPVAPRSRRRAAVRGRDRVPRGAHAPAPPARDDAGDGAARGRCGARLAGAAVVHYPLTLRIPTVAPAVGDDAARPAASRPARALLAAGAGLSRHRLAPLGARRRPGDRDQRVRPRPRDRPARARPGADPRHPPRPRPRASTARAARSASRSCSTPRGRWPHKNHAQALRGVCAAAARTARTCGSC